MYTIIFLHTLVYLYVFIYSIRSHIIIYIMYVILHGICEKHKRHRNADILQKRYYIFAVVLYIVGSLYLYCSGSECGLTCTLHIHQLNIFIKISRKEIKMGFVYLCKKWTTAPAAVSLVSIF